ncbi:helix-turn-helix domain-containing protein [Pedobacter sp. SAFR-022]|uniref:helix-turn-helix domain-containing protein n=1 Tax=Pedobacter sp. SAFR-022 TaxID=3436861 RepID=UPI003F7CEB3E
MQATAQNPQETVFISVPIHTLRGIIMDCVNTCLKYHEISLSESNGQIDLQQDERFTIPQLAEYLKVNKLTIHRYKKNGVFPFYQVGRTVFFKQSEVDAAMSSMTKLKKGATK